MQNRTIFIFILGTLYGTLCYLLVITRHRLFNYSRSNCDVNALISNKKQVQYKFYELFEITC